MNPRGILRNLWWRYVRRMAKPTANGAKLLAVSKERPYVAGDVVRINGEVVKITAVSTTSASWDPVNGWRIARPKDAE